MTWLASDGFSGVMDSGKTYALTSWFTAAPAGGIMWDPSRDASCRGAAEIGPNTPAQLVRQALQSGRHMVYRSAGRAYADAEIAWIVRTLTAGRHIGQPVRRLAIDEAHRVMRTGRVETNLADEWLLQRHHSLEIGWASQVAESVDYEIIRTTIHLRMFRQPWRPWMQNQGFSREMMDQLAVAPNYSSLFRDLRQATEPRLMPPGS